MLVRHYNDSDLAALRQIHAAQNFPYAFPDLANPLFLTKLVLIGENSDNHTSQSFSSLTEHGKRNTDHPVGPGDPALSAGAAAQPPRSPAVSTEAGAERQTANNATESFSSLTEHGARNTGHAKILGAALLRLTAEAYLLLDPHLTNPRERWNAILALHAAAQHDAQRRGLEDVHAWLPPAIAQKFGRRLARLGWRRDDTWTPFCKRFYD